MLFKINTEMQKRQLTVVEEFPIQSPIEEASQENVQAPAGNGAEYVPLRQTAQLAAETGLANPTLPMARYTQTITSSQAYPQMNSQHQMSQMSDNSIQSGVSGGPSVYSITRQRDRKVQKKMRKE